MNPIQVKFKSLQVILKLFQIKSLSLTPILQMSHLMI